MPRAILHSRPLPDCIIQFRTEGPLMHGFINVFVAAAFAWNRASEHALVDILNETDSQAFWFSDEMLSWRDQFLSTAQVEVARRDFAHSFGSCSFDEPVADLRQLGWL